MALEGAQMTDDLNAGYNYLSVELNGNIELRQWLQMAVRSQLRHTK
jgi:hypothetical protein